MKKSLLMITSFIMCVMLFFGCSFIEPNKKMYYDAPVLEVTVKILGEDTDLKVTVGDLMRGLNEFGYSSYFDTPSNQTGYSDEEAIKKTAIDLLDEKILVEYANKSYNLTAYDKKEAKYNTYEYINAGIKSLEAEIRKEWKLNLEDDTPSSEEEGTKYEEYKKVVERVWSTENNIYEYKFIEDNEDDELPEILMLDEDIAVFTDFKYKSHGATENPDETDKKVFDEAKRRLLRALKINYAERGIVNKTDDELLKLEIKDYYERQIKGLIIQKMQKDVSDSMLKGEHAMETINKAVANKFINLYLKERTKYITTGTTISEAEKDKYKQHLKDNPTATPTFFRPVTGEHFYVQHILLSYTEAQKAEINKIKSNANMLSDAKKLAIEGIGKNITVNGKDWNKIYDEIKKAVDNASGLEEKAVLFRDYMFEYTGDTGTLNATGDYIIPLDESMDSMVKPFADTSRKLQEAGKAGGVDIVLTEYGWHIVMYIGMVNNEFEEIKNLTPGIGSVTNGIDESTRAICDKLYNTPVKAGHNKSYYDEVFEQIELANFVNVAYGQIDFVKSGVTYNWHKNVYNDVLKITLKR